MKIYITLADSAQNSDYSRLQTVLSGIGYSILGSYASRNCRTVVIDAKSLESDVVARIGHMREDSQILEVGTYMKFYCTLDRGVRPIHVNPFLRKILEEEKYEVIVYPSHSENGINYVGVNIKDLNPLDVEEMNRFKQLVKQINGVNNLIIY